MGDTREVEADARIPVVDDERPLREILARSLRDRSYGVRTAADARRALELLDAEDFDLVISDVRMPGPGIPTDALPLIFDPFFTTKGKEGTGMGLALSREFVREAGGRIRVSSEPGKGASFAVELPLVNREDAGG